MHRFYCARTNLNASVIRITHPQELHHLRTVLRLKKGAEVHLFNADGQNARGVIRRCGADQAEITILETLPENREEDVAVTLACAVPKKAKFEWIIEKSTELGVAEIIPLATHRTEVRFDTTRMAKKLKRYETVAVNAAKQCGRSTVPLIHAMTPMTKALDLLSSPKTLGIIPCLQGERRPLVDIIKRPAADCRRIVAFIGPEGDFTPQELKAALAAGCTPVTLGKTVLKVDTAAISVLAVLRTLLTPSTISL